MLRPSGRARQALARCPNSRRGMHTANRVTERAPPASSASVSAASHRAAFRRVREGHRRSDESRPVVGYLCDMVARSRASRAFANRRRDGVPPPSSDPRRVVPERAPAQTQADCLGLRLPVGDDRYCGGSWCDACELGGTATCAADPDSSRTRPTSRCGSQPDLRGPESRARPNFRRPRRGARVPVSQLGERHHESIVVFVDADNSARRIVVALYTSHKGHPSVRLATGRRRSPRARQVECNRHQPCRRARRSDLLDCVPPVGRTIGASRARGWLPQPTVDKAFDIAPREMEEGAA